MDASPMLGDLASGADPHTVAGGDVIEKLDETGDPSGAAGQPVVQRQRHQLGMVGTLRIHDLKAIDHVAGKIIAGREAAILIEPVVVGLEGIRNDQVARIADRYPIREFVVQRVSVIEKSAELDMEAPGVGARPAGHPANRPYPGNALDRLDAEADMLALDLFRHCLVIEPTIAMADDLVPVLDKGTGDLGVALGSLCDGQQANLDPKLLEQAEQAPAADARAVFEDRFGHQAAQA